MRLSEQGRKLLQSFEGLSLKAYPDGPGYSIGYGHHGAQAGQTITRAEAEALFDADVQRFENAVSLSAPAMSQHQFDAMVSLAYNIGTGGFSGSTVLQRHRMGDYAGAADAFRMWNKSMGQVHQGLVDRRERERHVYLYGYAPYSGAPSVTPVSPPSSAVASIPPERPRASLAGVGLLFFCPSCGSRCESVAVEVAQP